MTNTDGKFLGDAYMVDAVVDTNTWGNHKLFDEAVLGVMVDAVRRGLRDKPGLVEYQIRLTVVGHDQKQKDLLDMIARSGQEYEEEQNSVKE